MILLMRNASSLLDTAALGASGRHTDEQTSSRSAGVGAHRPRGQPRPESQAAALAFSLQVSLDERLTLLHAVTTPTYVMHKFELRMRHPPRRGRGLPLK